MRYRISDLQMAVPMTVKIPEPNYRTNAQGSEGNGAKSFFQPLSVF